MTQTLPNKHPVGPGPHCRKPPWAASRAATGGHREDRRSRPGAQEIPAPPIADAAPPVPPISRPPPGVRPLCRRDRTTCDHVAHQTTPYHGLGATLGWTVAGGGWERSKPEGFLDVFWGEERKASIDDLNLSFSCCLSEILIGTLNPFFGSRHLVNDNTHAHIQNAVFSTKKQADAAH